MSVKVAGIWERGWNTPIKEVDLWEMVIREFGVDKYYMTPISGIDNPIVNERKSMEEIVEENKDSTVVFVDEKATQTLDKFIHPKKALYIFGRVGSDSYNLFSTKEDYKAIKILTPTNTALLWPHQIASLVLYDRFKKVK